MNARLMTVETLLVGQYSYRIEDLAIFRIVYAAYTLVAMVPVAAWVEHTPDAFFHPPAISLAALVGAPAPAALMTALNWALVASLCALLIGWKTPLASFAAGILMVTLKSLGFCLGKIDHDILIPLTAIVLACSGWGGALSVDARTGSPRRVRAWLLFLFAALIAFAMFTGGVPKLAWFHPDRLCTYGHLLFNHVVNDRNPILLPLALQVESRWAWKTLDYATLALELGMLPAVFYRPAFNVALAVGTCFHLGCLLLFDITFGCNVVAYAAFVPFASLPFLRRTQFPGPLQLPCAGLMVCVGVTVAAVSMVRTTSEPWLLYPAAAVAVVVAAGFGIVYLARLLTGGQSN